MSYRLGLSHTWPNSRPQLHSFFVNSFVSRGWVVFKILHKEFGLWNFATSIWIEGLWKSCNWATWAAQVKTNFIVDVYVPQKSCPYCDSYSKCKAYNTISRDLETFKAFRNGQLGQVQCAKAWGWKFFSCLRWKNMVCICFVMSMFFLLSFWWLKARIRGVSELPVFGCNVFLILRERRKMSILCSVDFGVCTSSVLRCWTVSSLVFSGFDGLCNRTEAAKTDVGVAGTLLQDIGKYILAEGSIPYWDWAAKISIMHWPNPHLRILTRLFNVVAYGKSILLTALFFQLFPTRFADWLEHVIFWVPPCVANSVKQKQRKERTRADTSEVKCMRLSTCESWKRLCAAPVFRTLQLAQMHVFLVQSLL